MFYKNIINVNINTILFFRTLILTSVNLIKMLVFNILIRIFSVCKSGRKYFFLKIC